MLESVRNRTPELGSTWAVNVDDTTATRRASRVHVRGDEGGRGRHAPAPAVMIRYGSMAPMCDTNST